MTPEPQPPLSGPAWRKAVRAALSAQAKARRIAGSRYTPRSAQGAGEAFRPGMGRKAAPAEADGGEDG